MFGRVNRLVVIGRCVFWAKAAADAAAGVVKRSAHRCDELHAALMAVCAAVALLQSACEAAAWCLLRVSQRRAIRQLFAALDAGTNDRRTVLMLSSLCCS
jgi:hypothetical protein